MSAKVDNQKALNVLIEQINKEIITSSTQIKEIHEKSINQLNKLNDDLQKVLQRDVYTINETKYPMVEQKEVVRALSLMLKRANSLSKRLKNVQDYLMDETEQESIRGESTTLLSLKIIESKEEERKRISRELHDGPAQILANIILNLDILERELREKAQIEYQDEVERIKDLSKVALKEIRQIIFELRPFPLNEEPFIQGLKNYLDIQKRFVPNVNILYEFYNSEHIRLPKDDGMNLFRVIQESIHNALKHAEADEIYIRLEKQDDSLIVTIQDNGIGIQNREWDNDSFGILGMKERIDLLKGELKIESNQGSGTVVSIKIHLTQS